MKVEPWYCVMVVCLLVGACTCMHAYMCACVCVREGVWYSAREGSEGS